MKNFDIRNVSLARVDTKVNGRWIMVYSTRDYDHQSIEFIIHGSVRLGFIPSNKFRKFTCMSF